jgi:hypothetical protein
MSTDEENELINKILNGIDIDFDKMWNLIS